METQELSNQIIKVLEESSNIAIIPSKVAGVDAFAAALGLFLTLKQKEKKVSLIHPGLIPEEFTDLIKPEEVITDPSLRELMVAIDYSGTSAAKVNYNTANDILYLKIAPVMSNFDSSRVSCVIEGFNFDLVITIGAQVPEDFGQTFTNLEDEFKNATILNVDNTEKNQRWGNINVIDANMHSLSLLALNNMVKWGLTIDSKSAKALLRGITYRVAN